jgi:hypothetical protein
MKRLLLISATVLALYSCKDSSQEEKNLLNDILKVHDKIMNKDEVITKNKSNLDSLLKLNMKDTAEKVNIRAIDMKLTAAEESMENWMTGFQPDMTGKSHDEVMKYYTDQKKQIMAIDSQVTVAIQESGKYLSNHNIK